MLEKIENFIELLISSLSRKRIIILIAIIFFFFVYQSKIENFIELNLLIDRDFSNIWLDMILLLASFYFSVFFFYKIFRDKYIPSYNEIIIGFLFILTCCYYLFKNPTLNWEFTPLIFFGISFKYIYFLLIPITVFVTCFCFRVIFSFIFQSQLKVSNSFLDDNPIDDIKEDELDYIAIVNELTKVLTNQISDKSFTIGLVGPWGNGKSSIIKMVSSQIKPRISFFSRILNHLKFSNDSNMIIINFMPYLNHKEEDIISEFFTSLSKELSYFNGKLANQILEYSKRLTNIYKENKLIELFENVSSKSANTPSKQLYDEINIRLKEIGKKIIVFIDDLDRLNENEILEVLKLIRNTADFNNTIFIVAMDKDYVIDRLKANNEILDSKFIDKFFQLEIYLPELESQKLQEYFVKLLLKSKEKFNNDFELRLNSAMKNDFNLFDLYIKNFRDVKRVVNQVIFEYPFFEKELDLKDFLNFTYFKLKFPKVVKLLNDNRNTLLEIDETGMFYQLPTSPDKQPKFKIVTNNNQRSTKVRINKFINLDKYVIYDKLKTNDLSLSDMMNAERSDKDLLLKSLVSLFGEENKIENNHSIKFENNFRKLMQQKILSTDLLEEEYRALFENANSIEESEMNSASLLPYILIEKLHTEKKINELLKRFDYFNSTDSFDIKWTILILGILFEKRNIYKINVYEIQRLLDVFIEKLIDLDAETAPLDKWLLEHFFDNILSAENRLILYQQILLKDSLSSYRGISEKEFSVIILNTFTEFIQELKDVDYTIDNYSIYNVYHTIKGIDDIANDVKKVFISFWNAKNIEILCIQMIDFHTFSRISFSLIKLVPEIFGSYNNFFSFLEGLIDENNKKLISEFLKFYRLNAITNYSLYIIYEFKYSLKMNEIVKEEVKKFIRSRDRKKKYVQVFFESNDVEIVNGIAGNVELESKYEKINWFKFENKFYIVINFSESTATADIRHVLSEEIIKNASGLTSWEKKNLSRENLLNDEPFFTSGDKYIKIYSIQPIN